MGNREVALTVLPRPKWPFPPPVVALAALAVGWSLVVLVLLIVDPWALVKGNSQKAHYEEWTPVPNQAGALEREGTVELEFYIVRFTERQDAPGASLIVAHTLQYRWNRLTLFLLQGYAVAFGICGLWELARRRRRST